MPEGLRQQSPTVLALGTSSTEDNFSINKGQEWFWDDSSTLHLLCTLFLLLLHQLHLDHQALDPGSWGSLGQGIYPIHTTSHGKARVQT